MSLDAQQACREDNARGMVNQIPRIPGWLRAPGFYYGPLHLAYLTLVRSRPMDATCRSCPNGHIPEH
uniref:Uncharacterized protein n=1 Tax=Tanacetum cinerariifolium TaxID=118510 RepID=A0A699HP25_TANCI|nr:hypothetical protein [Tanacetum cinerariifolium]